MLIITGTGRCGTSMVAKFFMKLGINIGKVTWDASINAGGEDATAVGINRGLYTCALKHGSSSLYVLRNKRHILNYNVPVVKDPRFTWRGVIDGWLSLRSDIKVLLLVRDLDSVVKSRNAMKQPRDLYDPNLYTVERLTEDFYRFVSTLVKYKNVDYTILRFPEILDNYFLFYHEMYSMRCFDFSYVESKNVWNSVVDKSLVHYKGYTK